MEETSSTVRADAFLELRAAMWIAWIASCEPGRQSLGELVRFRYLCLASSVTRSRCHMPAIKPLLMLDQTASGWRVAPWVAHATEEVQVFQKVPPRMPQNSKRQIYSPSTWVQAASSRQTAMRLPSCADCIANDSAHDQLAD